MKPARFEQEKGFEHKWSTLKCHCKSSSRSSVFLKLTGRLGKAHSTGGERRPSGDSCHKFPSPPPSDCPLTFIRVTVQKKKSRISCFDTNAASSLDLQMQRYEAPKEDMALYVLYSLLELGTSLGESPALWTSAFARRWPISAQLGGALAG